MATSVNKAFKTQNANVNSVNWPENELGQLRLCKLGNSNHKDLHFFSFTE